MNAAKLANMVIPRRTTCASGGAAPSRFDLCVVGGGPAGLTLAARVARAGRSVCMCDPEPDAPWPNNYGVWVDEFEAMGLEDCLEKVWPRAEVFLGLGPDTNAAKELRRPYGRVNRVKLKARLQAECEAAGVQLRAEKGLSVRHGGGRSTVSLSDGSDITARLVADATGHARKLVEFDEEFDPGYQAAYGVMAQVDSHPFSEDALVFMDWRDDHLRDRPAMREANERVPTFLYVMPFGPKRIFLEETSLVARPAVPFDELKERFAARMEHLGIEIKAVEETEYCLIPMGGVLPRCPQRVLGAGGTAGMVHPATGYMVCRTLGAVPEMADAAIEQLAGGEPPLHSHASLPPDGGAARGADRGVEAEGVSEADAEAMAARVWETAWPKTRIRQREFFNFGMDILLVLDLHQIRQFFAGFFSLSDYHWQGFLSMRLSFLDLVVFGLNLFRYCSNAIRLTLISLGLPGLIKMLYRLRITL